VWKDVLTSYIERIIVNESTLIRRAGIIELLAKALRNEARQGITTEHDRMGVLNILRKIQQVTTATLTEEEINAHRP